MKKINQEFCDSCGYDYCDYDCWNMITQQKQCAMCGGLNWTIKELTEKGEWRTFIGKL